MQQLMENWRQYLLTEEELRNEIKEYLDDRDIVLTEAQLNEINWKRLLKKLGSKAAIAAAITSAGWSPAAQADAFDEMNDALSGWGADAPAAQAPAASSKLPADADAAKASLADIAAELEGADPFEEMNILNDYGLVDQSSSGGKTTLSFKLATGGGEIVTIQVPTSQVPAQLR